jgi:hypothetical protein
MTKAEELLASLDVAEHKHEVVDNDAMFVIDPITHALTNTSGEKIVLIRGEHNSERITVKMPRYIEGHDMALCNLVQIAYINIETEGRDKKYNTGVYLVDDLTIVDDETLTLSWLISKNATKWEGALNFMILFSCIEGKKVTYRWGTDTNNDIYVLQSIDSNLVFEDEYVDVIEQWKESVRVEFTQYIEYETTRHAEAINLSLSKAIDNRFTAMDGEIDVLKGRMDTFTSLPEGSTAGDAELADIRTGVDGTVYPNAGEAVRGQVNAVTDKCITQRERLDGEHTEYTSETGTEMHLGNVGEKVSFVSASESDVWTCNGNYFPTIENHVDNVTNFESVDISGDSIVATTLAGKTYQNIRTKPVFLKAGTYVFHREYDVLAGRAKPYEVNSIGFCYITICKKDGENISTNVHAIQGIETDKTVTFDEDVYILMNMYTNMNAALDYDLTLRFFNISITKDMYNGYIPYQGENVRGVKGVLSGFSGMRVYSDIEIAISYNKVNGLSYEDFREVVRNKLITPNKVVVCWGDSLTQGAGSSTLKPDWAEDDASYPATLGRLISDGKTVLNGGVGGEPSWKVASRQGGMSLMVEPLTIPADTVPVRVYFKGQEQDYFYDNDTAKWVYDSNSLNYDIATGETALVNPCYIGGIEGALTRKTVFDSNEYEYYFTRTTAGEAYTTVVPKQLVTYGYKALRDAIPIIWVGQNDAPLIDDKYVIQGIDRNRVQCMLDILNHNKYIVMDLPSGNDATRANDVQAFNQQFGSHYLNIRSYIVKYGVSIANSMGADISLSESDMELIAAGAIPSCFRIDGVHGNYWYYQLVARAVYEKGKDLGYWS